MSEEKEVKQPKSTEGKVLVDKEQLDTILNRLKTLEIQVEQGPGIKTAKEVKEKTGRLRKINGSYVLGFDGQVWNEYNEKRREEELFVKVKLSNGKTEKVNYKTLILESERVDVTILKQEIREEVKTDGEVEVRKVEDYKTVGTDVYVPMEVVTPIMSCTVKTPEGEEFTIESEAINI